MFHAPLGFRQQWAQPIVDVRRRAVVGMQSDQDRARLGDDVRVARKCACTQERVLYCRPGHVLGAADRDLSDSIRMASLNPLSAAFSVSEELTLMAA